MKISPLESRLTALERENRILKKKLERCGANRALLEEALASHIAVLSVLKGEIEEERNTYQKMNAKLRVEIEQEYREKARVQEQLYKLDRLNLIGEMAASIGHEVRNPLTTVRGYLQFFSSKSGFVQYTDALHLMIEELDRANSIITEFLSLAKNKKVDLQPGNLSKVLLAIKPMLLADAIRNGHDLVFDLQDNAAVLMNENEIRQLVINLIRNGLEAMSHPGRITVRTQVPGDTVTLSVQDTGTGIPPEVLSKLGTPFFTTKEKGSGLGLAVSYSIIHRHGASLRFETSPEGTTVTAIFNLANEPA